MSYIVAHMERINKVGLGGMQIHNQRERDSHTNPDIDHSRTRLNYDLKNSTKINYVEKVKEILKSEYKGKKAVRKDAVHMVSVIVTSDSDFFERIGEPASKDFFKQAYEWLSKKYGEQNVISATVHMDEKTPHMHFAFVPLTEDGRLSAKDVIGGKKDLQRFQDEIAYYIGKEFGLERGERGTSNHHLTEYEFKIKSKQEQLATLDAQIRPYLDFKDEVEQIQALEPKKGNLGQIRGVTVEQIVTLKQQALRSVALSSELAKSQEQAKNLSKKLDTFNELSVVSDVKNYREVYKKTIDDAIKYMNEKNELEKELATVKENLQAVTSERDEYRSRLERVSKYLKDTCPEVYNTLKRLKVGILEVANRIQRSVRSDKSSLRGWDIER